jgi:hypothetical protein
MMRTSGLIATNAAAVAILLGALLLGWWEAAAFGLVVLILLDALVYLRQRQVAVERETKEDDTPMPGGDNPPSNTIGGDL